MKVLVFMEIGADVRIPPECDPRSGRVRKEWLVREPDAAGARALDLALDLKSAHPGTEVTVVHLGVADSERWVRWALARGCDRAVRVWDAEIAEVHAAAKAVVLAAAAEALGFDVVLTGAAGVLEASGQLGVLVAEQLGLPAVTQVSGATLGEGGRDGAGMRAVTLLRELDGGYRERVEAELPLVVTVTAGGAGGTGGIADAVPAEVPVAACLAALAAEIPVWDLADLGVPIDRVRGAEQRLCFGPARSARPRLVPMAAPDSALPAFERVLKLVQGTVQRREGRVVRGSPEEIVEEVFQTLMDEGWLDHLRDAERP